MYGEYDVLPAPVEQDVEVDFICFTDSPGLRSERWNVVVDPPRYEQPRLAAKVHKMLPRDVLGGSHRWALWVDANVLIDNPAFAREAIAIAEESRACLTTFRHPQRDCIYEEASACMRLPACAGMPVREQVAAYRAEGHPAHWGLYGCRSLAWDASSDDAFEIGRAWLRECETWTQRDQLSLPVVARRLGVRLGVFPHHLFRHTAKEAASCLLTRQSWAHRLIERAVGREASGRAASDPRQPVPLRRFTIGNPWFDVVAHRRDH